jgi:ketosteroid isomerase-like protein
MSQENVEMVHRVYDALNRGDLDRAFEHAAGDYTVDWSNSIGPARGVYRGQEEVREFWATFVEAFSEIAWRPEEVVEIDESTLVIVSHFSGRGRGSGVEIDAVGAQLWRIRDGKMRSVTMFQSKAEALEASGLQE